MKINVSMGPLSCQLNVIDGDEALQTLGELRKTIGDKGNFDSSAIKIIHRGKTLNGKDDLSLIDLKFAENDKLIVMGKPKSAMKTDSGFAALNKYEKDHLVGLQQQLSEISKDLGELEKNFLDEVKSREMVKKMDKRLKMFTEVSLRHLEALDGMSIITPETSADQAVLNREKRKSLVVGIQNLLNLNDKNVRRLEEFLRTLDEKAQE